MRKYIFYFIFIFIEIPFAQAFLIEKGNWGLSEKWLNIFNEEISQKGDSSIVVAIIDTGIDFTHPDLQDSQWINPQESGSWEPKNEKERLLAPNCFDKRCNKIDDDGNGFIDDVSGFDFVTNSNFHEDYHSHGSHIAGIIVGKRDFKKNTGGVAPNIKIASYRYYQYNSEQKMSSETEKKLKNTNPVDMTIKSIKLAIKHKVKIINFSGGGNEPSLAEKEAIEEAKKENILVIVAAGNDGSDIKNNKYYPCAYKLDNVICVGNVDAKELIAPTSNKGKDYVDIFAPGTSILSTGRNHDYIYLTGTSQSTAFITGIAALILSEDPTLTPSEVKKIIVDNANKNKKPQLKNMAKSEGFINLRDLLQEARDYSFLKKSNKDEKYSKSTLQRSISSFEKGLMPLKETYKQELKEE